jgi:serine protease Do
MSWADDIQSAVRAAIETVGPAVAGVGRGPRGASGLVVGTDAVLAVGRHRVGDAVTVRLGDEDGVEGTVRAVDGGLAVIAVPAGGLEPPAWGDAEAVGPGTPLTALANPGGRGLRVGVGVVSGVTRSPAGAEAFEHAVPLPRGAAGGPLLDPSGRVVGINALRRPGGLVVALLAGADLRARVDALARGESRSRPTLGVALTPPRAAARLRRAVGLPERAGLLVRDVLPGGPAERAGIGRGDLLVAAAGRPLERIADLRRALGAWTAEAPLALGVVRGLEEREVAVARGAEG